MEIALIMLSSQTSDNFSGTSYQFAPDNSIKAVHVYFERSLHAHMQVRAQIALSYARVFLRVLLVCAQTRY